MTLTPGQPYLWAPPLRTYEKIHKAQILAGLPKHKSGPRKGEASKGGRPDYLSRRKADHNLAKLAQKQYEQLLQ